MGKGLAPSFRNSAGLFQTRRKFVTDLEDLWLTLVTVKREAMKDDAWGLCDGERPS